MQRVRNEAHRFTITFHRLRNRQSFGSILEEVKGIGPKRKKKLLSAFDDLRNFEADSREISKTWGFGKTIEELKALTGEFICEF